MIAYKLLQIHKDGSIGSLFINKKQRIESGIRYKSECHPTKGFAVRQGWHTCITPNAPHLYENGRAWYKVFIEDYTELKRPESQGGKWFIANYMTIIEKV